MERSGLYSPELSSEQMSSHKRQPVHPRGLKNRCLRGFMSLAIRAWTSLFLLIEIFEAVQLKVVDCRSVWKSYSDTVLWAFFLAVATHQTSILIDHHHLRFVLIETKAGDGTGIDTSPTLRAGRLIQFDA